MRVVLSTRMQLSVFSKLVPLTTDFSLGLGLVTNISLGALFEFKSPDPLAVATAEV